MGDLTLPRNEHEEALENQKLDLLAKFEEDREKLKKHSLFELRRVYLAELEANNLPYTELDTKDKFIDLLIFLSRRRLECIQINAAEARVSSAEQLQPYLEQMLAVAEDWSAKVHSGE